MGVDPVLIPAVLSLSFQGIIGVISQIQHSRCTTIRGCGFDCTRKIIEEEEKQPQQPQQPEYVAPVVQTELVENN
jgi:hypothetical protein